MLSRKKIIGLISLLYWGLVIGFACVNVFAQIEGEFSVEVLKTLNSEQIVSVFLTLLFLFMIELFAIMIEWFHVTIIYLGGIVVIKKFYKEKANINNKKNDNYYRNLLKEYPVGVLGYIRDFNVNESELVGTILSLELKNKIIIEDKIEIKDSSLDDLSLSESYVLECLVSNKQINLFDFTQKIKEDSLKLDLLMEKKDYKKKRNIKIVLSIIFIIVLSLISNLGVPLFNTFVSGKSEVLVLVSLIIIFGAFLLGFLVPIIGIVRIFVYSIMTRLDPYVRNKKAMELNEKLNGLENFLKDFSIIHQRNSKELILWKDYLIYSVIFEDNKELKEEIMLKLK